MKILMTSETFLPAVGGAEVHVSNLIDYLKAENYEVQLFTNQPTNLEIDSSIKRIIWAKKNFFKIFLTLWNMSRGCDLIHAHYCHRLAFFVGVIGRLRGIPVVITLHGMGILDPAGASLINRQKHAFYRFFSLKLSSFVISTSEDLAYVAYRYIPKEKLRVILNGYDSTLFKNEIIDDALRPVSLVGKKIVMSVRRLVPKNGIHYLIESIPSVLKEVSNAHFLILGDGPLREQIERRVVELKIEKHVTLLGRILNTKVPNFLKFADVVVFPSTAESSSIACAEAMGMSKVVVASRVGGLIELIGENNERGILVDIVPWTYSNYDAPDVLPQEKYKELANCIVLALQSDSRSYADAAHEYALENLTWKAIVFKTIKVYKDVIKK